MEAFEPLYGNLWKFILSITRDKEKARDILSETVLIAFEKFDSLKNEKAFLSFLFTIVSRLNSASFKKLSKFELKDNSFLDEFNSSGLSPEMQTDIELLYGYLDLLPEKHKEALILFEIFGFSRKEIAETQNTSVTNVKIRLYRARKTLEKILKGKNS